MVVTSSYLNLRLRSMSLALDDIARSQDSRRIQDLPPPQMICRRCEQPAPPHYSGWCRFCRQYET